MKCRNLITPSPTYSKDATKLYRVLGYLFLIFFSGK